MKSPKLQFIILLTAVAFVACKKDKTTPKDIYPEPTKKGVELVAYRVNGKPVITKGINARAGVIAVYNGGDPMVFSFVIGAKGITADKQDRDITLRLQIREPIPLNTPIELRSEEMIYDKEYVDGTASYTNLTDENEWGVTRNDAPGHITITRFDSGILSGTFSFKATNYILLDRSPQITEGIFDVHINK